jgi:hypothetical protein
MLHSSVYVREIETLLPFLYLSACMNKKQTGRPEVCKHRERKAIDRERERDACMEEGDHHTMQCIMMLAYTSFISPKGWPGLGSRSGRDQRPQVHIHCWLVHFDELSL